MSFLNELQKQRDRLKVSTTVVTKVDGQRYVENKDNSVTTLEPCTGFVVDTKPDNIPVLVTNYVYIGSQDCAVHTVLESFNIKHVLSLGINMDVSVSCKFVPFLDLPETDIKPMLSTCLTFIREAVENRENVLVHCNAGVSRTSAVVLAYLMHYEYMTFEKAYELVKCKRPAIRPNDGFRRQLQNMVPGRLI